MKTRLWLFQIPTILFFTTCFWISELGVSGDLDNQLLRESVFPVLRKVSTFFTDMKFRLRGPVAPKSKIVIVEVDNQSIEALGRWPWHRDVIAFTLDTIMQYEPKVVGFDVVFSEPDIRIPEEVKEYLAAKNVPVGELRRFESDLVLLDAIARHRDRLVLGWASEHICQPRYRHTREECPVEAEVSPEEDARRNVARFEKFAFDRFEYAPGFTPESTAINTAISLIPNIQIYNDAAKHSGSFNAFVDPDGYIRKTSLLFMRRGVPYPALALEMAKIYRGEEIGVKIDSSGKIQTLEYVESKTRIPTSPLGAMEINFRGKSRTFPYVSLLDLLRDDEQVTIQRISPTPERVSKAELFKDAAVLIGVTALGVYDMRHFPFETNAPGVDAHANILDNLISVDPLIHGSTQFGILVVLSIMLFGGLLFAFASERLESIPALGVFFAVFAVFGFVDIHFLFRSNQSWDFGFLFLELLLIFVSTLAIKYVLEEKDKKFIRTAFSKYVSPAIVDDILKDPSKLTVGGEKKEITILFSDIRSFTTFSERMDAKALAKFLNDYLGIMTDIVFKHHGTLDKYIGDAVMAFWGAPGEQPLHAKNACTAAVEMIQALGEHQGRFKSQYGLDVQIGIGLNTGQVNVGNMGSERIFEYTVIGDSVNLASRLEGLTKYYGANVLTTRFTFDSIHAHAGPTPPPNRTLDFVKVKGKKNAVELIQLLPRGVPEKGILLFDQARALYTQRQWDQAIEAFGEAGKILSLRPEDPDMPCQLYVERCETFKKTPPDADWDGSWEMTSK